MNGSSEGLAELMDWLQRLSKLVRMQPHHARDVDSVLKVYADQLVEYPPPVVKQALKGWAEISDEWPSWRALVEALQGPGCRRLTPEERILARPVMGFWDIERIRRLERVGLWDAKARTVYAWVSTQAASE
jgi:hypothetical protein